MDERSESIARRFEWPMFVAALLVIPAIAIEQSDLGRGWDTFAAVLNWSIWLAFAAEVVVMLRVVPNRRAWLFEHPLEVGIVLLTPPFLPASLQAARAFRLLRVVRLLRVAKLARQLFSPDGIRLAAVLALLTVLGGGAAFAAVENGHGGQHVTAWDGVWWAMTTVTTVGYGTPKVNTDAGRAIGLGVMLLGIGFIALITAAAAQRFLAPKIDEAERETVAQLEIPEHEVLRRLDDISARLAALERR